MIMIMIYPYGVFPHGKECVIWRHLMSTSHDSRPARISTNYDLSPGTLLLVGFMF